MVVTRSIRWIAASVFLVGSLITGLLIWAANTPARPTLSGVLHDQHGEVVADGFYDVRIIGYDAEQATLMFKQDVFDVEVSNGGFSTPIKVKRFGGSGEMIIQLCHSVKPTEQDGFWRNDPTLDCEDIVSRAPTTTVAECPQHLEMQADFIQRALGIMHLKPSASCAGQGSVKSYQFAPTSLTSPPAIDSRNVSVDPATLKGARGVAGKPGPAGPAGKDGEDGAVGPAGADGTGGGSVLGAVQGGDGLTTLTVGDTTTLSVGLGGGLIATADDLAVDTTTAGTTLTTASNSGLEVASDGLRLIGGCAPGEILKWDGTDWACNFDNGAGTAITSINGELGPAITINGTANQVTVTTGVDTLTLSLPQHIATTSTPTFGGLTLNGGLSVTSGG
ncbi:MAG: yapH, partial [Candidatus Saccharibacteria bacterium]|nr:yapH [Candidatus Saccharibacteria bacterium]